MTKKIEEFYGRQINKQKKNYNKVFNEKINRLHLLETQQSYRKELKLLFNEGLSKQVWRRNWKFIKEFSKNTVSKLLKEVR